MNFVQVIDKTAHCTVPEPDLETSGPNGGGQVGQLELDRFDYGKYGKGPIRATEVGLR